jgi:hypothetical protein
MTQKLNIDKAYSDTVDIRPAGNMLCASGAEFSIISYVQALAAVPA